MAYELFNLPDAEHLLAPKSPVLGFLGLLALWITQGRLWKSVFTYIPVHYLDFLPGPFYCKGRQKDTFCAAQRKRPDVMLKNLGSLSSTTHLDILNPNILFLHLSCFSSRKKTIDTWHATLGNKSWCPYFSAKLDPSLKWAWLEFCTTTSPIKGHCPSVKLGVIHPLPLCSEGALRFCQEVGEIS